MKVHVDSRRCQGAGLCVAVAPEVFEIQPDGVAAALVSEVTDDLLVDAEEAVVACPTAALALSAGDDPA